MNFVQLVFGLCLLAFLGKTIQRIRTNDISMGAGLCWVLLWLGGLVVVIRPETTMPVARFFGVGRGTDLVVYGALVILFAIVFQLAVRLRATQREITALVRAEAVRSATLGFSEEKKELKNT